MSKIRVLVVDDSVVVRKVVSQELANEADIEVVGTASNGQIALARVAQLNPDLVILDVEMPEMDGLTALAQMRVSHPQTRVIMFSSLTERGAKETLDALALGAADYFTKPSGVGGLETSRALLRTHLVPAIRELCRPKSATTAGMPIGQGTTQSVRASASPATANPTAAPATRGVLPPVRTTKPERVDVLAIGASTGGPNAIAEVFAGLPAAIGVPIVIVQHMPPMFTRLLAERLTKNSKIPTQEAVTGEELLPGKAWIAPGDYHLVAAREGTKIRTKIHQAPHENSCRPAVDPLFRSLAEIYGPHVLAIVLTGMGQDGLRGAAAIAEAKGQIIVQDEATSVVWGMPGFVAKAGLADKVLPISEISAEITRRVRIGRA